MKGSYYTAAWVATDAMGKALSNADAARAYVEAATAWTVAAERWAASGREADMREAARQGALCAAAAAACLWTVQADTF